MKLNTLALAALLALSTAGITENTSAASAAAGNGTINLALDSARYCAKAKVGNFFTGVTPGVCGTVPPTSCPDGRIQSLQIAYPSGGGQLRTADVTKYNNIWGYYNATAAAPADFPGLAYSQPALLAVPRTGGYIAAQFTVPLNIAPTKNGYISRTDYNYGGDLVMRISQSCGDFTSNPVCLTTGASGATGPRWGIAPSSNKCTLVPGQTYFLNIKQADPTQVTHYCPASSATCPQGTSNNVGG